MRAGLCAKAAGAWPTSHPAEPWLPKLWGTPWGCSELPDLLTKGLISIGLASASPNATMRSWFGTHFPGLSVWGWWCLEHPSRSPVCGCRRDGSPGSWEWVPAVAPGHWPRAICIISQFSKSLDWVRRQEIFSILLELQVVCYGFYKALKRLSFQPICYSGYILSHFFTENYLLPAKYSMLMTY